MIRSGLVSDIVLIYIYIYIYIYMYIYCIHLRMVTRVYYTLIRVQVLCAYSGLEKTVNNYYAIIKYSYI